LTYLTRSDVPYSPSFVLPLADVSPTIKNVRDLLFLPGFHSPTLALLFEPMYTWAGRYRSNKDTFHLEIRTFDLSAGGTYPLLTSVTGLPSDSLYIVACPTEIGGVVVVTTTGIIHVDQSGRRVRAAVNGWWEYTTAATAETKSEDSKLSLEGSHAEFVSERDMLLVTQTGAAHQVRFEMDGRAVGAIKVDEQTSSVPPPSTLHLAGPQGVFVGCAEGDSLLAQVDLVREAVEQDEEETVKKDDMDDWDEDLYGEADGPTANGNTKTVVASGPATVVITPQDVLAGIGRISDIEFGIAVTDQGVS